MAYRLKAQDTTDGHEAWLPTDEEVALKVAVSGPNKLLGRVTTGAGAHEEIDAAALPELTDPEAGDFLYAESAEGVLSKVNVGNLPSGGGGGGASYLVYTALLSQSSADDPTVTVLENTLGATPTWTRNNTGEYVATTAGLFTEDKTVMFVTSNMFSPDSGTITGMGWVSDSEVKVFTSYLDNPIDSILYKSSVEIRIYP